MSKFIIGLCAIMISLNVGCISINRDITVEPTKSYEGRYSNTNELVNAAKTVELKDGESVWMLSNTTLKRLLINSGK